MKNAFRKLGAYWHSFLIVGFVLSISSSCNEDKSVINSLDSVRVDTVFVNKRDTVIVRDTINKVDTVTKKLIIDTLVVTATADATIFYRAISNEGVVSNALDQYTAGASKSLRMGHYFVGLRDANSTEAIVVPRPTNYEARILVRFDLSKLPAGVKIINAGLRFTSKTSGVAVKGSVHRLTQKWEEGTIDDGCAPGINCINITGKNVTTVSDDAPAVTWKFAENSSQKEWTTPGGSFMAAASDSSNAYSISNHTHFNGKGILKDVKEWHLDPSKNFGWIYKAEPLAPNRKQGVYLLEMVSKEGDIANVGNPPSNGRARELIDKKGTPKLFVIYTKEKGK